MQFKNFQFLKLQFLSGGKFRKTKLHLYRILTHSSGQVPWPTYQHTLCVIKLASWQNQSECSGKEETIVISKISLFMVNLDNPMLQSKRTLSHIKKENLWWKSFLDNVESSSKSVKNDICWYINWCKTTNKRTLCIAVS